MSFAVSPVEKSDGILEILVTVPLVPDQIKRTERKRRDSKVFVKARRLRQTKIITNIEIGTVGMSQCRLRIPVSLRDSVILGVVGQIRTLAHEVDPVVPNETTRNEEKVHILKGVIHHRLKRSRQTGKSVAFMW